MINVCDPSGMLPTADCPSLGQRGLPERQRPGAERCLYRRYAINRETGAAGDRLHPATIDRRPGLYLVVPPEARCMGGRHQAGDKTCGVRCDPAAAGRSRCEHHLRQDIIHRSERERCCIQGTGGGGEGFVSYRLLAGQELNPQEWLQVGRGKSAGYR